MASNLGDAPPELVAAYNEVFSTAYGSMVLRDLAVQCGYTAALPRGADALALVDHNARRAVFGRLFEILRLSPSGKASLVWASMPGEDQGNET